MKRSVFSLCSAWLLLLLVLCSLQLRPTNAQFGVAKAKGKIKELLLQHQADLTAKQAGSAEVNVNGDVQTNPNPTQGILSPKDAADMEEILLQASQDEETMKMVIQMKIEMRDEIEALGAEPSEDILRGMLHQLVEMRFVEVLF